MAFHGIPRWTSRNVVGYHDNSRADDRGNPAWKTIAGPPREGMSASDSVRVRVLVGTRESTRELARTRGNFAEVSGNLREQQNRDKLAVPGITRGHTGTRENP